VFGWILALSGLVVVLDQATKLWAVAALSNGHTVVLAGDLLRLRLVYNPGAAFSLATGYTWVLTIIAAVAVVVVTYLAWRVRTSVWAVALGLILGGATTHLLDRLLRPPGFARGHIVDFIDYAGLFVGNVADIAIVAGVALALVLNVRGIAVSAPGKSDDADSTRSA